MPPLRHGSHTHSSVLPLFLPSLLPSSNRLYVFTCVSWIFTRIHDFNGNQPVTSILCHFIFIHSYSLLDSKEKRQVEDENAVQLHKNLNLRIVTATTIATYCDSSRVFQRTSPTPVLLMRVLSFDRGSFV